MASRRQPEQEGNDNRNIQSLLQDSTQAKIARALRTLGFSSMAELQSHWEPLLRRVVQEEVSSIIERYLFQRNTTGRYEARAFQLCFMNKLPRTIYTSSKLTAEDGAPIQIALYDARSQNSIVRNAPQSFKIEICPLDGEFSSDDWTANEFNAKIVRARDNRAPLLKGDTFVKLENGIGFISEINFTDNSSWMRSGKFRIGARVVNSAEAINIREARSDPFRVMDSRGEPYKKHDYPTLNDPIWRLKKIRKNGKTYKHLSSHGIATVKDLLHLRMKNPASFEQIFGSIPRKSTKTIIEHALACREDLTEGPSSVALDRELPPLNDFMAIDGPLLNSSMNSLATSLQVQAAGQFSNPDKGPQQFVTADQKEMWDVGGVHNSQVCSDEAEDWIRSMLIPIEEGFGSEIYIEGISSQTNYHLPSTGNGSYIGHASSSRGNRRALWRKIRNILKWVRLYAAHNY